MSAFSTTVLREVLRSTVRSCLIGPGSFFLDHTSSDLWSRLQGENRSGWWRWYDAVGNVFLRHSGTINTKEASFERYYLGTVADYRWLRHEDSWSRHQTGIHQSAFWDVGARTTNRMQSCQRGENTKVAASEKVIRVYKSFLEGNFNQHV